MLRLIYSFLLLNCLNFRHKAKQFGLKSFIGFFSLDSIHVKSFVSNTPPQGRNVKNVWLRLFSFQNDRYSWTKHQIRLLFCCQRFRYIATIDDRCCLSGWLIHHWDKETRLKLRIDQISVNNYGIVFELLMLY